MAALGTVRWKINGEVTHEQTCPIDTEVVSKIGTMPAQIFGSEIEVEFEFDPPLIVAGGAE